MRRTCSASAGLRSLLTAGYCDESCVAESFANCQRRQVVVIVLLHDARKWRVRTNTGSPLNVTLPAGSSEPSTLADELPPTSKCSGVDLPLPDGPNLVGRKYSAKPPQGSA